MSPNLASPTSVAAGASQPPQPPSSTYQFMCNNAIPGDDSHPHSIASMESHANRSRSYMGILLWGVTARAISDRSCTAYALLNLLTDGRCVGAFTMAPSHSPSQHGCHAVLLNGTASSGHHRNINRMFRHHRTYSSHQISCHRPSRTPSIIVSSTVANSAVVASQ